MRIWEKALKTIAVSVLALVIVDMLARIITYGFYLHQINKYPEINKIYKQTVKGFSSAPDNVFARDPEKIVLPVFPNRKTMPGEARVKFVRVKDIDEKCFRNPLFKAKKQKGVFRILCIGGSSTYSGFVEPLDELFKSHFGRGRVEVLNLGLPGAYIAVSDYLLRRKYQAYSPDMIFIYHGFNDISRVAPLPRNKKIIMSFYARKSYGIINLIKRKFHTGFIPPDRYIGNYSKNIQSNSRYYKNVVRYCLNRNIPLILSTFASPDYENIPREQKDFFDKNIKFLWPHLVDTKTYGALLTAHNLMVARVASENGLPVIRAFEKVKGGGNLFLDNCHLTEAGKKITAKVIYKTIAPLVEKRISQNAGNRVIERAWP